MREKKTKAPYKYSFTLIYQSVLLGAQDFNLKTNKMKKMRTFSYALIAALVCVGFVACSDDDAPDAPKPTVDKRLVSYSDYSGENCTIEYDADGRISKVSDAYDAVTFTYNKASISVSGGNNEGTYTLKDGLITEWRETDGGVWKFTYSQGRLTGYTDYYGETTTYTWKDGDIVTQEIRDENGNYKTETYTYATDYDYGTVCAFLQSDSYLYDNLCEFLILQGYFGKTPVHLPNSIHEEWSDGDSDTGTITYRFDADGYPSSMNADGDTFTFTWVKK